MKTILTTLSALTLIAAPALAQDTLIDTDGDGMVSWDELQAALPDATEEAFTAADVDADGMLTAEELLAAQDAGTLPMGDT